MKVFFYGRLADLIGREIEVDAAGCSVAELRRRLIDDHPEAQEALGSTRVRALIGDALVHDDYEVDMAESVEFLPPVSGG